MEESKVDEIIDFYVNNNVTMSKMVELYGISTGTLCKYLRERNIKVDSQRTRRGQVSWNKGLSKHSDHRVASYAKTKSGYISGYGYRKVWSDELKKSVNEHHYIWFKNTGYWPDTSKGEQVHHIDGDKLNNNYSNLLLVDVANHSVIHKKYEQLTCLLIKKGYITFNKDTNELETEFLWRMLNENEG